MVSVRISWNPAEVLWADTENTMIVLGAGLRKTKNVKF